MQRRKSTISVDWKKRRGESIDSTLQDIRLTNLGWCVKGSPLSQFGTTSAAGAATFYTTGMEGRILPALQGPDDPHWMKNTRHIRQLVSLREVDTKALARV